MIFSTESMVMVAKSHDCSPAHSIWQFESAAHEKVSEDLAHDL
jgi:hypothetical protein